MYPIVVALASIILIWIYGAIRAGLFIVNRHSPIEPRRSNAETFSRSKKYVDLGWTKVAYVERGEGEPVLLLHGCPFQSDEWREVIRLLESSYRVIAPDLLGLGDTVVNLDDDYRLPTQVKMILELLDYFAIQQVNIVGHDHGAAIAQLMMDKYPERLRSVVLTNAEAYDKWPSDAERTDVTLVVNPLTTPFFRLAFAFRFAQRWLYRIAVARPEILSDEMLDGFVRPHLASASRWARLRRFFRWQLDREHNLETLRAVEGLRKFKKPTLLLWGGRDTNFDLGIARQLEKDVPGVVALKVLESSAHLPMLEEPAAYAASLKEFYSSIA